MKKHTLALLLAVMALLISCNSSETIANKEIDNNLKTIIRAKNDSLIQAVIKSDNKALKELGNEKFVKSMHAKISSLVSPFRRYQLAPAFTVFDEYHTIHGTTPSNYDIKNEEHAYTFTFQNNQKETYVSLITCKFLERHDYLITVIYGKEGNDWKIDDIKFGALTSYGKTADDLYKEAVKQKEAGFLLDAFFSIDSANDLLEPAENSLKYNEEDRINFYSEQWLPLVQKDNPLPYVIEDIKTEPVILEITVIQNEEGQFPIIKYVTSTPVTNLEKLQQEYELVKQKVKEHYTQMDFSNKNYVYYRAHNMDGEQVIADHTFIDKK